MTPLVGVRALFLYPLNALINSQQERLAAWTAGFNGAIRFCLYNGATPESVPSYRQAPRREEVLSRRLLRESPPPILVTNATMLEYMLVRRKDRPIIEQSQGTLRWVVLDEAHTYLGSNAAEISLLLRRVMHAFSAEPSQVRFVATSATIGNSNEDGSRLQAYLADLAGVPLERVSVIGGRRVTPLLPPEQETGDSPLPTIKDLAERADYDQRRDNLARVPAVRNLRHVLTNSAMRLDQICETLGEGSRRRKGLAGP